MLRKPLPLLIYYYYFRPHKTVIAIGMRRQLCTSARARAAQLLGVSVTAAPDEVKAAFRRKALRLHPDAGGCQQRFIELQSAYMLLGRTQTTPQHAAEGTGETGHTFWRRSHHNHEGSQSDEGEEQEAAEQYRQYYQEWQRHNGEDTEADGAARLKKTKSELLQLLTFGVALHVVAVGGFHLAVGIGMITPGVIAYSGQETPSERGQETPGRTIAPKRV